MSTRLIPVSLQPLRDGFACRLKNFEHHPPTPDHTPIECAVKKIAARVGGTGSGKPSRDRLKEAVELVFTKGVKTAFTTHARYIFWVLLEPWGNTKTCLVESLIHFNSLCTNIRDLANESALLARDWRGLLAAYMVCPSKHEGWRRLRHLLNDTLPYIRRDRFVPEWLTFLDNHKNILGESPTTAYADDLFAGRDEIIEQLRDVLGIPPESWFWAELLLSQVELLCQKEDERFLTGMETLLPQLDGPQFQLIQDVALTWLLNRYERGQQRARVHPALRDSSLKAWGSPHLARNSKWGLVEPNTKMMVRSWLTRQAIVDFFSLLSDDGQADQRRLDFWLRYQGSIDSFHFALGPRVAASQETDYRKIRETYRGHFCELTSPGTPDNNAFLLTIGNYIFVEFGVIGNACYCYQGDHTPFALGSTSLDLSSLKRKNSAVEWLVHRGLWENNFKQTLQNLGISPDATVIRRPAGSVLPPSPARPLQQNDSIISTARQKGIPVEDNRWKGGCLWILYTKHSDPFAGTLSAAGFRYYEPRGWWIKN